VSSGLITLFIQLPGSTTLEVVDTAGPYVGHIKDAIIAKFKLDAAPHHLLLFKLDDAGSGSRTLLIPTQTLSDAGIISGTTLVVELTAATQAPLAGMWEDGLLVPVAGLHVHSRRARAGYSAHSSCLRTTSRLCSISCRGTLFLVTTLWF
jgi:hypothetical protein